MLAGEMGPVRQLALAAPDQGGRVLRRAGFRAGYAGARHGGHREPRRGRGGLARRFGEPSRHRTPRLHPDDHRSTRHRFLQGSAPQAGAVDAGPRAACDRRLREARRADDGHLHQLPDGAGAHARRASGVRRHRRRDLFEFGVRGALELRGRAVGVVGRAYRAHATLWLSPRSPPSGDAARAHRLDADDAERVGRARWRHRPARGQLLGSAGHRRHRACAGLR